MLSNDEYLIVSTEYLTRVLDICTVIYEPFASVVELWLKIIEIGCPTLKAHLRIVYGSRHKKFAHSCCMGAG